MRVQMPEDLSTPEAWRAALEQFHACLEDIGAKGDERHKELRQVRHDLANVRAGELAELSKQGKANARETALLKKAVTALRKESSAMKRQGVYTQGVLDGLAGRFGTQTSADVAAGAKPKPAVGALSPLKLVGLITAVLGAWEGARSCIAWIATWAPLALHTYLTAR